MSVLNIFVLLIAGFLSGPVSQDSLPSVPPVTANGQQTGFISTATEPVSSEATSPATPAIQKLAKCLTAKNVIMYGAYWCPHCAEQKKMFADAFKLIHYQECDSQGANGNPQACQDAGVKGYPTWKFADGKALEGTQNLEDLAKAANCPLT